MFAFVVLCTTRNPTDSGAILAFVAGIYFTGSRPRPGAARTVRRPQRKGTQGTRSADAHEHPDQPVRYEPETISVHVEM